MIIKNIKINITSRNSKIILLAYTRAIFSFGGNICVEISLSPLLYSKICVRMKLQTSSQSIMGAVRWRVPGTDRRMGDIQVPIGQNEEYS